MCQKYNSRRIFTDEQEVAFVSHLVQCAKMCYGLDTVETRRLAFEMAQHNGIEIPPSWLEKGMEGIDWLYGFRERNPCLSLRRPEPCSLSRATSFNKYNVGTFFDNLKDALSRATNCSDGARIFNLEETGTSTVQTPKRILAPKNVKRLNKASSGEKGTLVTTCCIISASGFALPPVMVFPRVHFKEHMIKSAPLGTLGLATPSGWMNSSLFPKVMQHL
jgi:hypothetical protein